VSAVDTGDCQCVRACVFGFQWIFTTALAENVLDIRAIEQSHCVVISSSVLDVKLKKIVSQKQVIYIFLIMLAALNGKGQDEDPYTPSKLIQSLISQGWFIPRGEQDAHELFHVIVATLEEEIQQPLSKVQHLFY